MNDERKTCITGKLPPPVGTSEWDTFSQKCICVDKTQMIKELVDRVTTVALFTRPRRFGKTTALKMIRAFFEKRVDEKGGKVDTSYLFKDKKIWAAGEEYRRLQGQFPVIWLSFKDHKAANWEDAFEVMMRDVGSEISRHRASIENGWDDGPKKDQMRRVVNRTASFVDLTASLGYLAEAIHAHWKVKPVILIDEYDQPISSASTFGYYDKMCAFMRVFLSGALKDNAHVEMGLMTGVLRVAKEGILSGLNNLKVYTVFDAAFSDAFGFTEDEVSDMAAYYGVPEKMEEIRAWYDGYDFAGTEIYNPWSVLYYFSSDCKPGPYWLDTSSNDLITEIVRELPHNIEKTLHALLRDDPSVNAPVVPMASEFGPYADVKKRKDTLYALLVSAGYLKVASPLENGYCRVRIPNRELEQVFVRDIQNKINEGMELGADEIAAALLDRDPVALKKALGRFLVESVSYFDSAAEGFYHGLTLGFLAILRNRYRVTSNGESGDGRFDLMLRPYLPGFPGFVIEVKAADTDADDLKALAAAALRQIDEKDYPAALRAEGVAEVVKLGLAYRAKRVELAVG